jgi:hypothetical protein
LAAFYLYLLLLIFLLKGRNTHTYVCNEEQTLDRTWAYHSLRVWRIQYPHDSWIFCIPTSLFFLLFYPPSPPLSPPFFLAVVFLLVIKYIGFRVVESRRDVRRRVHTRRGRVRPRVARGRKEREQAERL